MGKYSAASWTDDMLLELIRLEDDRQAFSEIYQRYFGLLYAFIHHRMKDEDDAKDILQELFTSIWDKRLTLNFTGQFSAYLYAAVRNRMLDVMGKKDVQGRYVQSLQHFANVGYESTDHMIREKQLASLIEQEINALPAKMREVFLLSRQDHFTYREIAEKLDISEQTVRSHVKHALRTLRVRLGLVTYLSMLIQLISK